MADTTAPVLVSLTLPGSVDYLKSKDVSFGARATDEGGTGISYVLVEFAEPLVLSGKDDITSPLFSSQLMFGGVMFTELGGHNGADYFNTYRIGAYSHPGTYTVGKVTVADKASNFTVYTTEQLEALGMPTTFTLAGTASDFALPQLKSLSLPTRVDESKGPVQLTLRMEAGDGMAGVNDAVVMLDKGLKMTVNPAEPLYTNSLLSLMFDGHGDSWSDGKSSLTSWLVADEGVYNIDYVDLRDKAGNLVRYSAADLAKLGVNTTLIVDQGNFQPNRLTQKVEIEARESGGYDRGAIVVKLSADQWLADKNVLIATLTYDPKVARFDGWRAGSDGAYEVDTGVTEVGTTGLLKLNATIANGGDKSDFIELRFRPLGDKGSFALGVSDADLNGKSLPNDFATKLDFSVPLHTTGGSGDDRFGGSGTDDVFEGLGGNDVFSGLHGGDRVDGGSGRDTVRYAGKLDAYRLEHKDDTTWVARVDGSDGAGVRQELGHVERIAFDDVTLAFDHHAAQAQRLYQAAFDRKPDLEGLGFWLDALDHGVSLREVARNFVSSSEFKRLYGDNPTNAQVVDGFYHNVLHRDGDAEGVAFWNDALDHQGASVAQVLVDFSESPENQAQVAELIANGVAYIPYA